MCWSTLKLSLIHINTTFSQQQLFSGDLGLWILDVKSDVCFSCSMGERYWRKQWLLYISLFLCEIWKLPSTVNQSVNNSFMRTSTFGLLMIKPMKRCCAHSDDIGRRLPLHWMTSPGPHAETFKMENGTIPNLLPECRSSNTSYRGCR